MRQPSNPWLTYSLPWAWPLQHKWFFEEPLPCRPDQLPKFEESHEMNMKKRRHEVQQAQQHHTQQQSGRQQRQRTDGACTQ